MARRALRARWSAATLCLFSSLSRAATLPSQLTLEVTSCESSALDAAEAEHALLSELEADGIHHVAGTAGTGAIDARLTVNIGCDSELSTLLTLSSARSGRERWIRVALADADPSARARALALLASEFMRSDWPALNAAEVSSSGQGSAAYPAAEPARVAAPKAAAAATSAATKRAKPARTSDTGTVAVAVSPNDAFSADRGSPERGLANHAQLNFAASARFRVLVDYASLNVGADAGADFGALRLRGEALLRSANDPLGSASMGSAALCVGYRVFDARLGAFSFSGYPLFALGATWMRGSPTRQTVVADPTTRLYADVRFLLESRLTKANFSPILAAEVGRASGLVARAGDRVLGATGGFFVGASAGARY